MIDATSCYVNPNTWTLTSNIKNTAMDKKYIQFMSDELKPVENVEEVLKTPMNLAGKTYVNKATNSLNVAEGAVFYVNDGYLLRVKSKGIEVHSTTDTYNHEAYLEAQALGSTLGLLLRNAGGTQKIVAVGDSQMQIWTKNITELMKYIGIDPSMDFTVNGMRYSGNDSGYIETEANSVAKEAWEQQRLMNKTYEFADERTRKRIEHISGYYLEKVPENIKVVWQETLDETGINPFPSGYCGVLQQLAQEQDFATGGNDKLFGDTIDSFLVGLENILERIVNPISEVTELYQPYVENQKRFYTRLFEKINTFAKTSYIEK